MTDTLNAFVEDGEFRIEPIAPGVLDGMEFVAKDLFDVAGHVTGGGNPDWAAQTEKASRHAWAVEKLLSAGAALVGKTITDEVSLGILGENAFYGTPVNSAAPDRVPGGSSSGTAAAVAGGAADFGIGTDTGGSVRVPSSFCGLYGIRPTHGRLKLDGMMPQAPSSDTTGWLARDAETFIKVSSALLEEEIEFKGLARLIVATDAMGFADPATAQALQRVIAPVRSLAAETVEEIMAHPGISVWGRAQRTLQMAEAWGTFKHWIDETNPRFAFNVARGLLLGSMIPEADRHWASLMRREAKARLSYLLQPGTVMVLPTTPFPAPMKGLPISEQNEFREAILSLCGHGGLAGFPQVNVPGASVDGAPVGLSLMAARGEDASLVALTGKISELLK